MPDQSWSLVPYLRVQGAAKAISFYEDVFGATELFRQAMDDGRIGHAELDLHGNRLHLADSEAQGGDQAPVFLHFELPDVDATFAKALAAGATLSRPLANQEYGHRNGAFIDPFGILWYVTTPLESAARDDDAVKGMVASVPTP